MNEILILDCGGQYTHLIKQILTKAGISSTVLPADVEYSSYDNIENVAGIVISGGSGDVRKPRFAFDFTWLTLGLPVFGICYGHQLIAHHFGSVIKDISPEFGLKRLQLKVDSLSIKRGEYPVWQSHSQAVYSLPSGAEVLAVTDADDYSFLLYPKLNIYSTQFHPEVSHSLSAQPMLVEFCKKICNVNIHEQWSVANWYSDEGSKLRSRYRDKKIIIGLSGGVDSMTLAAFIRRHINKYNLLAVYVDTGFMPDETLNEVKEFCTSQDIQLKVVRAQKEFIACIKGVRDPREKGKLIGKRFIKVFERVAREFDASHLAQGTIWSDVVESGVTKFSSKIKPHHNVGGLPRKMKLILVEPFRELFKDQVRSIALHMNLPKKIEQKKVFPGPGFSIRIDGEVTLKKLKIIKSATRIVDEVIDTSVHVDGIWMAFPILVNAVSLGVKGDKRIWNKQIVVLRVVESKNSMTVTASEAVYPLLKTISRRLVNELRIGRVVYDLTDKPPGTIEWQ